MQHIIERLLLAGMVTYILYAVYRLVLGITADRNLDRIYRRFCNCFDDMMARGEVLKADWLRERVADNIENMPEGAWRIKDMLDTDVYFILYRYLYVQE